MTVAKELFNAGTPENRLPGNCQRCGAYALEDGVYVSVTAREQSNTSQRETLASFSELFCPTCGKATYESVKADIVIATLPQLPNAS